MNILFFLTPKASCAYVYDDYTIRQALERMEISGYSSIPILTRSGAYRGALTEGDLLWAIKNVCRTQWKEAENHSIMEIPHHRDNAPVSVTTDMRDLVATATSQNFVPVIDDKGDFIGIVTRQAIMQYCLTNFISPKESASPQ